MTTATLDRLREVYPGRRFEVRRFRPSIVVQTAPGERSFVESNWVGRTITIGAETRLKVIRSRPRRVMTTLPKAHLTSDPGILRADAQHNGMRAGIYAEVIQGGPVRRNDPIRSNSRSTCTR
jgi:uncharacterized protein YcbX